MGEMDGWTVEILVHRGDIHARRREDCYTSCKPLRVNPSLAAPSLLRPTLDAISPTPPRIASISER